MKNQFVIMNTKKNMNLSEAIRWYDSQCPMTIIQAIRFSNRGATNTIYILGSGDEYYTRKGNIDNYIQDSGNGYTGSGQLKILNVMTALNGTITSASDPRAINEKKKHPVWVMK